MGLLADGRRKRRDRRGYESEAAMKTGGMRSVNE
jgi:hypothetical protein